MVGEQNCFGQFIKMSFVQSLRMLVDFFAI